MKLSHSGRDRHTRRVAVRKMLKGKAELRVKKYDTGYRLVSSNGEAVAFGPSFAVMTEAVAYGERHFGKKAKQFRVTKKAEAAA